MSSLSQSNKYKSSLRLACCKRVQPPMAHLDPSLFPFWQHRSTWLVMSVVQAGPKIPPGLGNLKTHQSEHGLMKKRPRRISLSGCHKYVAMFFPAKMAVEVNPLCETRLKLDTSSPSLKFACAGPAENSFAGCRPTVPSIQIDPDHT